MKNLADLLRIERIGIGNFFIAKVYWLTLALSCSTEDSQTVPKSASLIDGMWQGRCVQDEIFEAGSRKDLVLFESRTSFQRVEGYFDDTECRTQLFQIQYSGRYELFVSWIDYVHKLDIDVDQIEIFGVNQDWIDVANAASFCDYVQWQVPLRKEGASGAAGAACPLSFLENQYYQTWVKVKEQDLIFSSPFQAGSQESPLFDDEEPELNFVRISL